MCRAFLGVVGSAKLWHCDGCDCFADGVLGIKRLFGEETWE